VFVDHLSNLLFSLFREEGMYTIKAVGFNSSMRITTEISATIADVPCDMPSVSVSASVKDLRRAVVYTINSDISLEGIAELKCNKSVNVV